LLRHFYADVRQDSLIGPISNAQIKDSKEHLEIIASFWETIIGGLRSYARAMPLEFGRLFPPATSPTVFLPSQATGFLELFGLLTFSGEKTFSPSSPKAVSPTSFS
jgi:hypothetical protein